MSDAFSELPEALQQTLIQKGFSELTQVQKAVSASESLGRDLRISSQTGSGKTVAVGIAIARELLSAGPRSAERAKIPEVLVLTPTRELAAQVQRELAWLFAQVQDASVEVVTGGTSVLFEKKRLAQGPRVVVGTPGRVLDHLTSGSLVSENMRMVVLDEADQMLDMGFRDELEGILDRLPEEGRRHLLSATFSGEVLAVAKRYQKDPVYIEGSPLGSANSDIEHLAYVVPLRSRYDALINLLLLAHARRGDETEGRTLIFTRTRADTIEVAERLQRDGVRAEPLSGDLAQAQRTRTLSAFRSGRITTLVATDVAARGLDVQGIDLVIHFEPPGDPDSFTHRSGRTGRAGQKGTSILLLPPQARRRVERLLAAARVRAQFAPVPAPEKIEKAFQKLGRRRIHEALEKPANESQITYAKKLLEEHAPEQVIGALLEMVELRPPCAPREVSVGFSVEHPGTGREPRMPGGPGGRGAGGFRPRGGRPPGSGARGDGPPPFRERKGGKPFAFQEGGGFAGRGPGAAREGGAAGRLNRPFKKAGRPRPAGGPSGRGKP